MKRLEQLPEVANRQLGGLTATSTLLAKAKLRAAEMRQPRRRGISWRPALAVCAALVLCVGAALWASDGHVPGVQPTPTQNVLGSRSAGDSHPSTAAPRTAGDVPVGSLSMSAGSASSNQTLFAQGQGQSFPLITMDGATYRMLQSPTGISSSLLGEELGQVTEFNVEPALGTSGMVSNVVTRGETVYAISGMSGALVAAQVDGSTRVFQRVSYAGTAIIGSETLADTLCDPADVEWMELAGTGRISDVATAQQLMQILVDYADYQSTAMSGSGSLLIGLKNGLTLQLLVSDESVSACGTWSCPDFFEAFDEAVAS